MKKILLSLMMFGIMSVSHASNEEITKKETQCCCKSGDTVDCCEDCNDCCESC